MKAVEEIDTVVREFPTWRALGLASEETHQLLLKQAALQQELENVNRRVRERRDHIENAQRQIEGCRWQLEQEIFSAKGADRNLKAMQRQLAENHYQLLRGCWLPDPPARVRTDEVKRQATRQFEREYGPSTQDLLARVSDLVRNSSKSIDILANITLNELDKEEEHPLVLLAEFRNGVSDVVGYPFETLEVYTREWLAKGNPLVSSTCYNDLPSASTNRENRNTSRPWPSSLPINVDMPCQSFTPSRLFSLSMAPNFRRLVLHPAATRALLPRSLPTRPIS